MMNANIGTARTNAANSRCSCATAQIATRLPTIGKRRYSASAYGVALAAASSAARSAASPSTRGVGSTTATGARYGSRYSRFVRNVAISRTAPNITRPVMGPRRNNTFRFKPPLIRPFATLSPLLGCRRFARRSFSGGRRRGSAGLPLAFEITDVGDDRPSVCRRDRPAVSGHQSEAVGDHVEDLPVRVLQNLFLVEARGRNVAPLEQDSLAVAARVVTRLAVDRVALPPTLQHRVVHLAGDRRHELSVRALSGIETDVFFQTANRDRSGNRLTHGLAVEEE